MPEKSTAPPRLLINRAWPPVLEPVNKATPRPLLIIVALPAVVEPVKCVSVPSPLFVIVASPAVLVPLKNVNEPGLLTMIALPAVPPKLGNERTLPGPDKMKLGAFDELLTMPPINTKAATTLKE